MTIDVIIESCPGGVRVSTGSPLNFVAEAETESQAIEQLKGQYRQKLSSGTRLATLSLDSDRASKAWDQLASIPESDWTKYQDAIREYRESCDLLEGSK